MQVYMIGRTILCVISTLGHTSSIHEMRQVNDDRNQHRPSSRSIADMDSDREPDAPRAFLATCNSSTTVRPYSKHQTASSLSRENAVERSLLQVSRGSTQMALQQHSKAEHTAE